MMKFFLLALLAHGCTISDAACESGDVCEEEFEGSDILLLQKRHNLRLTQQPATQHNCECEDFSPGACGDTSQFSSYTCQGTPVSLVQTGGVKRGEKNARAPETVTCSCVDDDAGQCGDATVYSDYFCEGVEAVDTALEDWENLGGGRGDEPVNESQLATAEDDDEGQDSEEDGAEIDDEEVVLEPEEPDYNNVTRGCKQWRMVHENRDDGPAAQDRVLRRVLGVSGQIDDGAESSTEREKRLRDVSLAVTPEKAAKAGMLITTATIQAQYNLSESPERAPIGDWETVGDMVLNPADETASANGTGMSFLTIAGKRFVTNLWSNPQAIKYCFSPYADQRAKDGFRAATVHFADKVPCLGFVEIQPHAWQSKKCAETPSIFVHSSEKGCFSQVGMMSGGGSTGLHLEAPGCTSLGISAHELGHAVGMHHEMSRRDRDTYVNVHTSAIETGKVSQYAIEQAADITIPYDIGSLMHYGDNEFGWDRNGKTMTYTSQTEDTVMIMGNRMGLSSHDARQLARMYGCEGNFETFQLCPTKPGKCRSDCICPQGSPYMKVATTDANGNVCFKCMNHCPKMAAGKWTMSNCACSAGCTKKTANCGKPCHRCVKNDSPSEVCDPPSAKSLLTARRRRTADSATAPPSTESTSGCTCGAGLPVCGGDKYCYKNQGFADELSSAAGSFDGVTCRPAGCTASGSAPPPSTPSTPDTTAPVTPPASTVDKYSNCPDKASRKQCDGMFSGNERIRDACPMSCADAWSVCAGLASSGSCDQIYYSSGDRVRERCSQSCRDKFSNCGLHAAEGKCSITADNGAKVRAMCPDSCRDAYPNCPQLATEGKCSASFSSGPVASKCMYSCRS